MLEMNSGTRGRKCGKAPLDSPDILHGLARIPREVKVPAPGHAFLDRKGDRMKKCLAEFLRVDGDEGPVIQLDRVAVATAAALRGVPSRPAD